MAAPARPAPRVWTSIGKEDHPVSTSTTRGAARPCTAALCLASITLLAARAARADAPSGGQGAPPAVQAAPSAEEDVDEILIIGQRRSAPDVFIATPERATPNAPDTAELLKLIPGGDIVDNGPLTGQVQYRGMFGDRVHTRVGGMFISPGGPNWMDTPLHYAPRPILDHLEMDLGIASVSSGSESIGGSANAILKSSEFGTDDDWVFGTDVEVGSRTADKSFLGGGLVSTANRNQRFHLLGTAELGADYRVGGGAKVRPSGYERYTYGGGYGVQFGENQLGIDFRHNDTRDTGTPVLPMDIIFIDTELLNADYHGMAGSVEIDALLSWNDIDHAMDNYSLREPPVAGPMGWRRNNATSQGFGYAGSAGIPLPLKILELGVDGDGADHNALITNPNMPPFFVVQFSNARKNRYGTWAEWTADVAEGWDLEAGIRYTRIAMSSDPVNANPPPMAPAPVRDAIFNLRDAFNAADRERSEDLVDAVLKVGFVPLSGLRLEVAGGRKTRAPSYVERYGWIPTQAAGGLADGRTYVGDLDLDPEVGYEATASIDWRNDDWGIYLSPSGFYRRVKDYIQGTPSENPDVTTIGPNALAFTNIEAELFGADLAYGFRLPWSLQLDGVLSYVRGKRVDEEDNLYRIAPLRGRSTLTFEQESWSIGLESVYAAAQNHVSAFNEEKPSDAWGILNVFATWDPKDWLGLVIGVNNVTDNNYSDHLAGTSRVNSSAVSMGEPMPAPGVNFFVRAVARF